MTASEWQWRRSEFNHDWLGNQFLPALAKCHRILSGEVEDMEFTPRFVQYVLPQWSVRVPDLVALLDNYEIAMSPSILVDQRRIGNRKEAYAWIAKDLHSLWKLRCSVDKKLSEAKRRLIEANTAFERIDVENLRCTNTSASTVSPYLIEQLQSYRSSCMALSDSIHALERGVQLV